MICIYDKGADKNTVLNTNGLAILDNICTGTEIKEVLNGEYSLTATFILDTSYFKHNYLVQEAIIRIPDIEEDEIFRINEVSRRSNGEEIEIEIYARHISDDTLNLFIESASITDGDGSSFLTTLSGATTTTHEFTFSSDLTNIATSYYSNMSLYEALFADQYCFVNLLGGEVSRRQYSIAINNTIGSNNGVRIQSKKNIQGFEIHTNLSGVITRIYPYGANGLTIPEKYIDSTLISNYANIRSKKVEFSDIGVSDIVTEAQAQQMLRDEVAKMYSIQKVDVLKAEYSVNYVDVSKTEEWNNMEVLFDVQLGDVVTVYEENFDINIEVRVTERTYDPINAVISSITLSNIAKKTVPNLKKIIDKIDELKNSIPYYVSEVHPKIYTGTTAPDPSLGQEGDVYIQY